MCHLKRTVLSLHLNQKLNNILMFQACFGALFLTVPVWSSSLTKKPAAASSRSRSLVQDSSVSKNLIRKRGASFQIVICHRHLSHMQTCSRPGARTRTAARVQTVSCLKSDDRPNTEWPSASGARRPYLPSPDESYCFNENLTLKPNWMTFGCQPSLWKTRDKMTTDYWRRFGVRLRNVTTAAASITG